MTIHEMYPYLCVADASAAIEFYEKAFGAREKLRLAEPGGRVGHAERDFGCATLMLADEFPEYGLRSPTAIGGTAVTIHLHVDDADALIRRAAGLGATIQMEPRDHSHGERSGSIIDPFGHRWLIGHSIEDVSPEEMQRRYTTSHDGR
jgi:PhnB protein